MMSTTEIEDSVNVLILTDRRVIKENISEQVGSSVDTAHKIVYDDFYFSKIRCHLVPKMFIYKSL